MLIKKTCTLFVEVGSKLSYAGILHHGGPIKSDPIGPIREALSEWLSGAGKSARKQLGFLFADKFRGGLKGKVEARPFVGVTKQTLDDVEEVIGVTIMEMPGVRVKVKF